MGTYVLALWLDRPQAIRVGRLGEIRFPAGWYLYVGSARGPGGLVRRLSRHRRRFSAGKRSHWHVDSLRERAAWGAAWVRASADRLECEWARQLHSLPDAEKAAPRFGASDCRCPAHLVRVAALPADAWFAGTLGAERIWMENEALDALLRALVSGDDDQREEAALGLGTLGAAALSPLAALLASGAADVRWWAARALADVGGQASAELLIGALVDQDADVRACASLALGRIGDGSAASSLAQCLADPSAFVANIAADALSMIGEPAVEALSSVLLEGDPHARLLAVRALARIGSESAAGPLLGALEDSSYLVRYYAHEALESLGLGMVYFTP